MKNYRLSEKAINRSIFDSFVLNKASKEEREEMLKIYSTSSKLVEDIDDISFGYEKESEEDQKKSDERITEAAVLMSKYRKMFSVILHREIFDGNK